MDRFPVREARDDPPPYPSLFPSPPVYESVAGSSHQSGYDCPPHYPGTSCSEFDDIVMVEFPSTSKMHRKVADDGTCPPGLEFLQSLDKVFIDEVIQGWQGALGIQKRNQYKIVNEEGDLLGMGQEDCGWVERMAMGARRGFSIRIVDKNGVEGIRVDRPLSVRNEIKVFNGELLLGTVNQVKMSCSSEFEVCDPNGSILYTISGPFLIWQTASTFTVHAAPRGQEIGEIRKQWSNFLREFFTHADIFGVTFPVDLNVRHKALLLGAVILIDFVYFGRTSFQNS